MTRTPKNTDKAQAHPLKRFIGWLPELSRYSFITYLVIAIVLCTTTIYSFDYGLFNWWQHYNIVFFVAAIALGLIGIYVVARINLNKNKKNSNKCETGSPNNTISPNKTGSPNKTISPNKTGSLNKNKTNTFKRFIIIGAIVLFILQLIVFLGKFFVTGWDVMNIIFKCPNEQDYFSTYPNNLFMHGISMRVANFIAFTGFDSFVYETFKNIYPNVITKIQEVETTFPGYLTYAITYALFTFAGIISATTSVILSTLVVKKATTTKFAYFAFVLLGVFIGLSPWILVPYSDIFSLLFVTIILWSYLCINNKTAKCAVITIALIIGFNIKPTVCFCVIAILVIEICKLLAATKKQHADQRKILRADLSSSILRPGLAIFVSAIVCISLVTATKHLDTQFDEERQMTKTHFLMMGMNDNSSGYFNFNDINYSKSFNTIEERENANIEVIKNRINEMGPLGFMNLMAKKTMINYSDGTFMWEKDNGQSFYYFKIADNKIINWIYQNDFPVRQTIWFFVLVGCFFCWFIKKNKLINSISLALLALSVFLLLFESGSRYLIIYSSYFMIMGLLGWRNLYNIFMKKYKAKQLLKTTNN